MSFWSSWYSPKSIIDFLTVFSVMIIPTLASQKDTKKDCTQNQSEMVRSWALFTRPKVILELKTESLEMSSFGPFDFSTEAYSHCGHSIIPSLCCFDSHFTIRVYI